jgi:putative resolvase
MYVGIHYFMELYGVSASTIRRWCDSGKLVVHHRTFGGHRRFAVDAPASETDERGIVGYARVSSYDQKSDLERQVERLKRSGCDEVLTDIGSGLIAGSPASTRCSGACSPGGLAFSASSMRTACCDSARS